MHFDIKIYSVEKNVDLLRLSAPRLSDALRQMDALGYQVISIRRKFGFDLQFHRNFSVVRTPAGSLAT